jgi:dihydroorotate dehydrogenase (fumarate)
VHHTIDGVKAIMAGADAVQMVSALLENGVQHLAVVRTGFERWCDSRGYESIDQVRDSMSLMHSAHPHAAERKNYFDILQSWKRAV